MLAIKEYDSPHADNAAGDVLDLFNESDAQTDTSGGALQSVLVINGNVDDRDLFARGAQEHDDANGGFFGAVPIESKESLGLMLAHAHSQTQRRLFDTWVTELLERIENPLSHAVLAGIEKQQVLQLGFAFPWNSRREDQIHTRFLLCTRLNSSPAELMALRSPARRLTP